MHQEAHDLRLRVDLFANAEFAAKLRLEDRVPRRQYDIYDHITRKRVRADQFFGLRFPLILRDPIVRRRHNLHPILLCRIECSS